MESSSIPDKKKRNIIIAVGVVICVIIAVVAIVVATGRRDNSSTNSGSQATAVRDVDRTKLPPEFDYGEWLIYKGMPVFAPDGETRPTLPQLGKRTWSTPKPYQTFARPLNPIFIVVEKQALVQLSSTDGPTKSRNGFYGGYAHSLQGAALAAINSEASMLSCGPTQAEATKQYAGQSLTIPCSHPETPFPTIPSFVRLREVHGDVLEFELAYDKGDPEQLSVEKVVVEWKDGDWHASAGWFREGLKTSYREDRSNFSGDGWILWSEM